MFNHGLFRKFSHKCVQNRRVITLEKNLLVIFHYKREGSFSMSEERSDFEEEEWDIEDWGDEWDDIDDDDW